MPAEHEHRSLVAELNGVPQRAAILPRWSAPAHVVRPAPVKEFSRTKRSELSLGPIAKVVITFLVLALAWWGLRFGGLGSGLILLGFALYVIRETWKRTRIR